MPRAINTVPGHNFLHLRGYKELGVHLHQMDDGELLYPSPSCVWLFVRPDQLEGAKKWQAHGWNVALCEDAPNLVQGIIVPYGNCWDAFAHFPEMVKAGLPILPGWANQVVEPEVENMMRGTAAHDEYPNARHYLAEANMKGHYLEFGTFFGRSFAHYFAALGRCLNGSFIGFDSFAGLPAPTKEEEKLSGDKFIAGNYACNEITFKLFLEFCGVDMSRVKTVPGFYDQTLRDHSGAHYGIEPGSVSVCMIDCDLKDATCDVLDFVTPLLEPGALIYFDDWLLTRGSPVVGERAAALEWLKDNPGIELIDFPSGNHGWQGRWFVYQKMN